MVKGSGVGAKAVVTSGFVSTSSTNLGLGKSLGLPKDVATSIVSSSDSLAGGGFSAPVLRADLIQHRRRA